MLNYLNILGVQEMKRLDRLVVSKVPVSNVETVRTIVLVRTMKRGST